MKEAIENHVLPIDDRRVRAVQCRDRGTTRPDGRAARR